jgi:NAD(P)-dependent dehydrogenase (short-subunit alcohol dehydrogenase family)
LARLASGGRRQAARTPRCPELPRLDGRTALVTGGGHGIGLETSRGLARRGARVISASRRSRDEELEFIALDLSDLESVRRCTAELARRIGPAKLDILIANAGLWPMSHRLSAQGHEIAFATNVLGHFELIRTALQHGLLAPDARVVILTGDIYALTRDCTPDYRYRSALGGMHAYCRSKLGNLWHAAQLAERHPELRVYSAHPGVIASDLGGGGVLMAAVKRPLMLSTEDGAQTTLFCATQPDLESGAYYHNTMGRVLLREDDPAADVERARRFWNLLEGLAKS